MHAQAKRNLDIQSQFKKPALVMPGARIRLVLQPASAELLPKEVVCCNRATD